MRFASDENFNGHILKALLHRISDLDIVRVQDTLMTGASDPDLLTWLAHEGRILLTHDVQTIPRFAYERLDAKLSFPGIIIVRVGIAISQIVDELEIMIEAGNPDDFKDIVRFIPL